MCDRVGKFPSRRYLLSTRHLLAAGNKLLSWLGAVDNISFRLCLRRVMRRVENRRHGLAQSLQRFVELALDVFRRAKRRMQNLPIVMFFEIGENPRSHGDQRGALSLVPAKKRGDFTDENSAGDSGGEDERIGNPVTHFSSVDKRCRLEKLLNDQNG